jgi:hypothetical protein
VVTLALTLLSERSMLDDEFERLKLDAWFAVTLALMLFNELSRLELELERLKLEA